MNKIIINYEKYSEENKRETKMYIRMSIYMG